jgi:hypothetical protein
MAYEESIIIPGGKLISNTATNPENSITFKRIFNKEEPEGSLKRDYVEVNCKIIINEYLNFINVIRDFDKDDNQKAVEKFEKTNNLIVLNCKKDAQNVYQLALQYCTIVPSFNKNADGQIILTLNSVDIDKKDHGGEPKKDHSNFPNSKI